MVKRYIAEAESLVVQQLVDGSLCAVSRLSEVEVTSALERRCREGSFEAVDRNRALDALRRDLLRMLISELTPKVSATASHLLSRHILRAGDSVQLACALELHHRLRYPLTFVAFDRRLSDAAAREGLPVEPR